MSRSLQPRRQACIETRAELKRLHQRLQTTTIYVTHDQEEAMMLGDRVAVMDAGQVQQCDAPLTVYRAPANRFVAGFLGTPGMNFLDGKSERRNGYCLDLRARAMSLAARARNRPAVWVRMWAYRWCRACGPNIWDLSHQPARDPGRARPCN